MSVFTWCSRRAGGLAMLATIGLSYWVISDEVAAQQQAYRYPLDRTLGAPPVSSSRRSGWVTIFSYYCLLIHLLVFMFPLRSCWAVFTITRSLRRAARTRVLRDLKLGQGRRGSSTSLSSSETLTSSRDVSSASSSEAGDLDLEAYTDGDIAPDRIIHAIVIPNYKEENDTLRETLEVLASHPQARNTYDVSLAPRPVLQCISGSNVHPPTSTQLILLCDCCSRSVVFKKELLLPVLPWGPYLLHFAPSRLTASRRNQVYLAMEQREQNVETKAARFTIEFSMKFRSIDFTVHPADIPGELAGKGSNMAWAARKLSEKYSLEQRKDVIVTGIDGERPTT